MKILVTGANGMLAKEVKERFGKENEIIATDVAELDITNEKAVMDYIMNLKPEYIINCAAYTAVDKAEENYELADKINGDGPANLKSIMGVMSLGVNNGAFITVCADGEDAEKAILGITQKIYEMHLGKEY